MTTQTEEFKNDEISVTVSKKPGCHVSMEIIASPASAEKARSQAIKNVRKEVSLPGFRKGKAPEEVVVKNFSKHIDREFREAFLNHATSEAIKLARTFPWNREGQVKADVAEVSLEKGGKFTIHFESFPTVPTVDPQAISVKNVTPKEITDDAVTGHIESLRYHYAKWNEVEGRPVQQGDFIEASVDALGEDGNPAFSSRSTNMHIHPDHLEEWMINLLLGKEKGFQGTVTPPEQENDELNPEVKIKPRTLRVTIDKILSPELEELSDAFASKFGAKDLSDLREKIKKHLTSKEEGRVKNEIERNVQKELLKLYHFDLPESLVQHEAEKQKQQIQAALKEQNHSDEEMKKLAEEVAKVAKQRADHMLRTHYLLFKIADDEKFEITNDEILKELMMMSMRPDGSFDHERLQHPEKYADAIRSKLRLFKAIDFVAKRVNKV